MSPAIPAASIVAFLRRARRRYLIRELLAALGASAAASLLFEYAIVQADRRFGLELPPISIGIVLLLLVGAARLRRSRMRPVAARADAGLRLQDRLATFLDFRDRPDIDDAFRRAQAGEAAAALSRVDLRRGIRIPRPLWAAPLLFAWMLYVDYFTYLVPFTPPSMEQFVRLGDPHRGAPRDGEAPGDGKVGETDERGAATAPQEDRTAQAPGENAPSAQDDKKPTEGGGGPEQQPGPAPGEQGTPPLAGIPAPIPEPARLFSEPVSASLTPVSDAAQSDPASPPPALPDLPLRGRISFNLVPADGEGSGPAGKGSRPGAGKAEGLGITVDYDAVPPEFRPHVRRYFNALVRLFQGGTDGT